MRQSLLRSRMLRVALVGFMFTIAFLMAAAPAQAQSEAPVKAPAKGASKSQTPAKTAAVAQAQMLAGNAPLVFEPNRGQAPANVQWLARGSRFVIGLTSDGAVLEFRDEGNSPAAPRSLGALTAPPQPNVNRSARPTVPKAVKSSQVKLHLSGSSSWKADGVSPTGGISNYFIGKTPQNWHVDIPQYAEVKASGVYAGIDVIFHGDRGNLEYDFVVAPGADPKQIELQFDGASGMRIDKGDLVLTSAGGTELRHAQPKIHQEVGGKQVSVKGGFEVRKEGTAGFTLGSYDPKLPLVIDPSITFTRFLGGSDYDEATAVAADPFLNSYVTGYTYSDNFPVVGEGNIGQQSHTDAFFTKLSPNGTILSSTYLGGSDDDMGFGIAVDASGIYLTGTTLSNDFPYNQPLQSSLNGSADAFVSKFTLLGDVFVYSTYLGGSDWDEGFAIAVDASRSAYVTGETNSNDFPLTPGAFEHFPGNGSSGHGFVTKLSPSGTLLSYSTYLGSSGADSIEGIAIDSSLSAVVTGYTCSFDFPFAGYTSIAFAPSPCTAIVTKLSPAGDSLIYSTAISSQPYWAHGIALDSAGNAYVTGNSYTGLGTRSPAAQAFVSKLSSSGAFLYFKQLVGTNGSSVGDGIATDVDGDTWVVGSTSSTDFPGGAPITPNPAAGFLVKLDKNGNGPLYTIFLGEAINGVAVIKPRPRVAAQLTFATIFTAGVRLTGGTAQSDTDAFVVRVDEGSTLIGNH